VDNENEFCKVAVKPSSSSPSSSFSLDKSWCNGSTEPVGATICVRCVTLLGYSSNNFTISVWPPLAASIKQFERSLKSQKNNLF